VKRLPSSAAASLVLVLWAFPSLAQSPLRQPSTVIGLRALGGFVNKQSLNGLQLGGEVYRQPGGQDEPVELAVGLFYGRVTRGAITPGCLAPPCSNARSFAEGTGLLLFNFEPGKRVRPFAGGGLTVGNYFNRARYYSIAVAGGVNVAVGNGHAVRIDARLAENFALSLGYGF
jgi:hypothetical protein